jgi:hypothetical protein
LPTSNAAAVAISRGEAISVMRSLPKGQPIRPTSDGVRRTDGDTGHAVPPGSAETVGDDHAECDAARAERVSVATPRHRGRSATSAIAASG